MAQLIRLLAIVIFLPLFGALGFYLVEDLSAIDSFYMSFITLSTVGYEVVKPLSNEGKIFVMFFLVLSFAIFFYALSQIGEMLVKGDLKRLLKRRIMDKQIRELSGHAIVCGFGRMGQNIALELKKKGRPFVVIDLDPVRINLAMEEGWPCLMGDASDDHVLLAAGIERAQCLTTVLPHDPDNLFCVMAARLLKKDLIIIARSNADNSIHKLKRAGATRIVSPYSTGAVKISQLMIHPELEDFLEIFSERDSDVDLSVIEVQKDSLFFHKSLGELDLGNLGVMVIGLQKNGQKFEFPPDLKKRLEAKDVLMVIGKVAQMAELLSKPHVPL